MYTQQDSIIAGPKKVNSLDFFKVLLTEYYFHVIELCACVHVRVCVCVFKRTEKKGGSSFLCMLTYWWSKGVFTLKKIDNISKCYLWQKIAILRYFIMSFCFILCTLTKKNIILKLRYRNIWNKKKGLFKMVNNERNNIEFLCEIYKNCFS